MWAKTQELECSRGGDHYLRFFDHRKIVSRSRRMFVIVFLSPTFFCFPRWFDRKKRKIMSWKNCNHINNVALRLPLLGVFCAKSQIPNQKIKAQCSTYFPLENFSWRKKWYVISEIVQSCGKKKKIQIIITLLMMVLLLTN